MLGIICPIAPTDGICFLSAAVGLKFSTYILTIIISNIPNILVYSVIGISFNDSLASILLVIMSFVAAVLITVRIWSNLKQKAEGGT